MVFLAAGLAKDVFDQLLCFSFGSFEMYLQCFVEKQLLIREVRLYILCIYMYVQSNLSNHLGQKNL